MMAATATTIPAEATGPNPSALSAEINWSSRYVLEETQHAGKYLGRVSLRLIS